MEEAEVFKKLLEDFSKIHIPKEEKTFMGICKYPWSRFEEICSRVLAFYFNPNEEHGFRDLWFRALNQCLKHKDEFCRFHEVRMRLEEPTFCVDAKELQKKRIDILIKTDNSIYIIENKIHAPLYNQLSTYSEHIETKYPNSKHIKIVLTAHPLKPNEKAIANNCGFEIISYKTLFKKVNAMVGDYYADSNVKQLTFMIDFMKTINNEMNYMDNKEVANFFFEHRQDVEDLINQYNKWKEGINKRISSEIDELKSIIMGKTGVPWEKYDSLKILEFWFKEDDKNKIGIVSEFKEENKNPLAKFKIYITTWGNPKESLKSWQTYEKAIMKKYNGCRLDEGKGNNGRVYLHFPEIDGSNTDEIINKLADCYFFLKDLVDKKDKGQ